LQVKYQNNIKEDDYLDTKFLYPEFT